MEVIVKTIEEKIPDLPLLDDGLIYRNKNNGNLYKTVILGYDWFDKNGKLLEEPIKETEDDYEIINEE